MKKYTLKEYLNAVRNNWEGYDDMRWDAIHSPGWGDGSDESCALTSKFNTDLYSMLSSIKGIHGGKVHLGHQTYTEIRFWGEKTRATPDGRRNGEYFSQGLTPSRLKKIPYVTSVINSMAALDKTELAGNNVINNGRVEGIIIEINSRAKIVLLLFFWNNKFHLKNPLIL